MVLRNSPVSADSQPSSADDVLVGDVVDRHEDLLEGVLDDRGQGAVPAVVLAAEGEPPALEPAGLAQRGVRAALAHPGGIEVGPVGGVQRHARKTKGDAQRARTAMRHNDPVTHT